MPETQIQYAVLILYLKHKKDIIIAVFFVPTCRFVNADFRGSKGLEWKVLVGRVFMGGYGLSPNFVVAVSFQHWALFSTFLLCFSLTFDFSCVLEGGS